MTKLKPIFNVLCIAIAVVVWFGAAVPGARAAGNQSNQDLAQPAVLYSPDTKTEINVYPKPSTEQRRIGYGLKGDPVTVLEQVGSNEGYGWDYVKFDPPSKTEGWVRDDFVSFHNGIERNGNEGFRSSQSSGGDRYLGNQATRSNNQASNANQGNQQQQRSQQQPGNYPQQQRQNY